MKKALLLLFALSVMAATPAFAQRDFLLGFTGFDYSSNGCSSCAGGSANSTTVSPFLNVGDTYNSVGFVTSFSTLFAGFVNNSAEHTYFLTGANVITSSFTNNVLEVQFAPGARIRVYEDNNHNADYGVNPANATSPSTFIDGNLLIGASVSGLALTYDYDANQGGIDGSATLDEGADLFVVSPSRRSGWVLSGQAGRPNATIPAGYVNQLSGEMQIPGVTPAAHKSWGSLKALYR
jgi:hypothetical protein